MTKPNSNDTAKGSNINQQEVDIVAIPVENVATVLVAEVKRQGKNFKPALLEEKVKHLRDKILNGRNVESRLFTLDDM